MRSTRDENVDASKTGRASSREEHMLPIDTTPRTLMDEKRDHPDTLNATRGDESGD